MSSLNDFARGVSDAVRPTLDVTHTPASPASHRRRRPTGLLQLPTLLIAASLAGCGNSHDSDATPCDDDESCDSGSACDSSSDTCSNEGSPDAGMTARPKPTLPKRWQCVTDSADAAAPVVGQSATLRVNPVDLFKLKLPPALKASACSADDGDCSDPIVDGIAADGDGYVNLDVPQGFDGYIRFAAPGYVTGLWYYGRPLLKDTTVRGPLMVTPDTLDELAQFAGIRNDPDHGAALVQVWDCDDQAADGVIFDDIAEQQAFYFDGALPSRTQHATSVSSSLDSSREHVATGGYSFLPPSSPANFVAKLDSATQDVIAIQPAFIRASEITYVRFYAGTGLK